MLSLSFCQSSGWLLSLYCHVEVICSAASSVLRHLDVSAGLGPGLPGVEEHERGPDTHKHHEAEGAARCKPEAKAVPLLFGDLKLKESDRKYIDK